MIQSRVRLRSLRSCVSFGGTGFCSLRSRVMTDPVISLLSDLVAIDSVNPSLVPGAAGEARIADAIDAHMRAIGLDVERQDVAPGRPNVVGVLEGAEPGPTLMFCGHIDT